MIICQLNLVFWKYNIKLYNLGRSFCKQQWTYHLKPKRKHQNHHIFRKLTEKFNWSIPAKKTAFFPRSALGKYHDDFKHSSSIDIPCLFIKIPSVILRFTTIAWKLTIKILFQLVRRIKLEESCFRIHIDSPHHRLLRSM